MWHILSIFYQNPHIQYIYIYICSIYIYNILYIYIAYILFISYTLYMYVYTTHTLYFTYSISILIIDTYGLAGCWENPPSPATGGRGEPSGWGGGGVWGSLLIYIYIHILWYYMYIDTWYCLNSRAMIDCLPWGCSRCARIRCPLVGAMHWCDFLFEQEENEEVR